MTKILATTCILAGALLAGGCATKKYVRNTTAPVQAKVDQVGEQTNRNSQAIDDARTQLKQVDERAQGGISAASERAATADAHAGEAMARANRAGQDAIAAQSSADKALRDVDGLRSVISNLDDYRLQSSVTVPFSFDKYSLDANSRAELDKLAGEIKSGKRFFIAVEGYTDSVGNAQYNEGLSRRRADAVVQYLVAKHDVPIYRIHMIGLGKQKPVDESRGAAARAKNRRVEVKVFSADADVSAAAPKAAVATTSSVR
jgi:outer membrane protein OmpA-like peptidoglycan-associated protein